MPTSFPVQLQKLDPRFSMSLKGFDRRGAVAALTQATATGFKVSGYWNDIADFAILYLHDADDNFGHLQTSKYLPDFNLAGIVLDYDLALTNLFSPISTKYDSSLAGQIWSQAPPDPITHVVPDAIPQPLAPCVTSVTGGAPASVAITISGTVRTGDYFVISYLDNYRFEWTALAGSLPLHIASHLADAINQYLGSALASTVGLGIVPFAVWDGAAGLTFYAGRGATSTGASPQFTLSGTTLTINQGNLTPTQQPLIGFWGVQPGDIITLVDSSLAIQQVAVASVTSPWSLTLNPTPAITITPVACAWPLYGRDGNTVELWTATSSTGATISPGPFPKLAGGADPTSLHLKIDFTALGIDNIRQAWLTFAPVLNLDTSGSNATIQPFAQTTWSAVFSNWTVSDPSSHRPLKIAGPGSVTTGSQDGWCNYTPTLTGKWVQLSLTPQPPLSPDLPFLNNKQVFGFYNRGFARGSAMAGDTVTIRYYCQYTHDLYLGTQFFLSGGGIWSMSLDGAATTPATLATTLDVDMHARRKIASSVAAGGHMLTLTVGGTGPCVFDYLQAVVASDVQAPAVTYANVSAAMDFDTDQSYKISPGRALLLHEALGFGGDIDLYAGVFFALTRKRYGGTFLSATLTLSGTVTTEEVISATVATTTFNVGITGVDTLDTLAQRLVNAINTTFVGVYAVASGAVVTVTVLSPINGFPFPAPVSSTHVTVTSAGVPGVQLPNGSYIGGQEGVWEPDASLTSPLNQGFQDWLSDFCALLAANAAATPAPILPDTCTVAFSSEILAPPDVNTSAGAWAQRFPVSSTDYSPGPPVLTDTSFGSWGAGYVEAYTAPTVTQTGHGYVTGNTVHIASATQSDVWEVTVGDADHYDLTTLIPGGYTPSAGDSVSADLQTAQCCFNPATFGGYLINCFKQTAGIQQTAGLTPRLQIGECPEWWFAAKTYVKLTDATNVTPILVTTAAPHPFSTGDQIIVLGVLGNTAANGTWVITKISDSSFSLNSSVGNGTFVANPIDGPFAYGGGMAYYDKWTDAQAVAALSRHLAPITCQDTDPATCSADVAFLASLATTFAQSVIAAIKAAYATAVVEWLLPNDVNWPSIYWNAIYPYAQGGRMNHAVNMPAALTTPGTSPFDRILMEGLSWGAGYRSLDNAKATMALAVDAGWAQSKSAYLAPIFNGGCPWTAEYLAAINQGSAIKFWAWDHFVLMNWPTQPMPANASRAQST
jgi:hypothetical protein